MVCNSIIFTPDQAPALLKAGYRVIVPDTLGYGRTDRPTEEEPYQLEKIIDHMFEIINELDLKDINLMGHDWGSGKCLPSAKYVMY